MKRRRWEENQNVNIISIHCLNPDVSFSVISGCEWSQNAFILAMNLGTKLFAKSKLWHATDLETSKKTTSDSANLVLRCIKFSDYRIRLNKKTRRRKEALFHAGHSIFCIIGTTPGALVQVMLFRGMHLKSCFRNSTDHVRSPNAFVMARKPHQNRLLGRDYDNVLHYKQNKTTNSWQFNLFINASPIPQNRRKDGCRSEKQKYMIAILIKSKF